MNLLTAKLTHAYFNVVMMADESASAVGFVTKSLSIMSNIAIGFGAIYAGWGAIQFFQGLKDKNGPDMTHGIWTFLSGAGIAAVGVFFATINIDFS